MTRCTSRFPYSYSLAALFVAKAVFISGVFPMRESHRGVAPAKVLSVGENGRNEGCIACMVFMGMWMVPGRLLVCSL